MQPLSRFVSSHVCFHLLVIMPGDSSVLLISLFFSLTLCCDNARLLFSVVNIAVFLPYSVLCSCILSYDGCLRFIRTRENLYCIQFYSMLSVFCQCNVMVNSCRSSTESCQQNMFTSNRREVLVADFNKLWTVVYISWTTCVMSKMNSRWRFCVIQSSRLLRYDALKCSNCRFH